MRRPPPLISLGLLLALCVGLVVWYTLAHRRGGISLPESGAFVVLRPVQRTLTVVGDWCSDVGRVVLHRSSIVSENEKLRAQVANLQDKNQRLSRYLRANEELRRLLNMPKQAAGRSVAADVISLDSTDYSRNLVLDVGSRQGVREKDVVYTARGVVGKVISVAPLFCKVQTLTDRLFGAGAMTDRTMAKGIVRGTGTRICKMSYLDFQADVRPGDLVLTSGEANVFPKGLVIGRVLKIEKDKFYSQMSAYIDPAVPFDQINAVYVRVQAGT